MRLPYFIDGNLPHTNLTRTYTIVNTAGVPQSTVTVPFYSNTLARPWAANPSMTEYVERFLRLAESRGIAVAWLLPPITRASPARRELL